jgi:hypothetical protein
MEKKGGVGLIERGTNPTQDERMVGSLATCPCSIALGKVTDAVEFEMGQFLPCIA